VRQQAISAGPERDDAPRLTREIAERAQLALGDKVIREADPPLGRRRGRPPKAEGERKEAVSLRLSPDVLAYFRAGGEGWQTRINEALAGVVGQTAQEAREGARVVEEREGYRLGDEKKAGGEGERLR
jgi:uncharacterized protein (DUF4415 family)